MLADRVGQGGELGGVEMAAGRERVRGDPINLELLEVGGFERRRLETPFVGPQKRVEAASESALVHGR